MHGTSTDPIGKQGNDVKIYITGIKNLQVEPLRHLQASKSTNLSFLFVPGFLNAQAWRLARQLHKQY
jgi:hypothetical protein